MKNQFILTIMTALALAACDKEPESTVDSETESETGAHAGPTLEQCLAETDETSCNAIGCVWNETLTVDASTCETTPGEGRCFTLEGESVGNLWEPHAFHRMNGDVREFMIWGIDCSWPAGWTECGGTMNSPAECGCLCSDTIDGPHCGESPACD
jgi:hypothetical protein